MQLNISGQHIDLTQALKTHVEQKLEKIKRHFDRLINIDVVLKVEHQRQIAEARIHLPGADLFAESSGTDMYGSIESMAHKLDSQVIKHKQKSTKYRSSH